MKDKTWAISVMIVWTWLVLFVVLIRAQSPPFPALAAPQTTSHSAALNWTASPSFGVAGYNVYRALCNGSITSGACSSEGAFSKINGGLVSGLNYTDATVMALVSYSWYVTAYCPTCTPAESNPSNHVATTIPGDPQPEPPGNLTILSVAIRFNSDHTQQIVNMRWTDDPRRRTLYALLGDDEVLLKQGAPRLQEDGTYEARWVGVPQDVVFVVCDYKSGCLTR